MIDRTDRIACDLLAAKYIRAVEYAVWRRAHQGETIYAISKDCVRDYNGKLYAPRTLYDMVQKVREKIDECREIDRLESPGYRPGHTVANGSKTRRAGDPTEARRHPDEESSWNEERLRQFGLLDRWSRKR